MNLSAEAVPCLSEVSASDKRWGPPPPVTDRLASWRLQPNLITPPGRDRRSALGLSRSGLGEQRGSRWRGPVMADKHSLLFPHRILHAGSLGATGACAKTASCREISCHSVITIMQFNVSVRSSLFSPFSSIADLTTSENRKKILWQIR